MTGRFTGPYQMPRGASGRVPNTSSPGGVGPPRGPFGGNGAPMGAPRQWRPTSRMYRMKRGLRAFEDFMESAGGRAAFPYAGLAYLDPAATRSGARTVDAFLTQFLPDWYFDPGSIFSGWGYGSTMPLTDNEPYDMVGWTLNCRAPIPPNPAEVERKVGYSPPVGPANCNVSGVGRANAPWGVTIPAGCTNVQLVQSGVPWPNANGRPYVRWTRVVPSTKPLVYKRGAVVLPLEDPWPQTQMEPHPDGRTSTTVRFYPLYGVAAMSVTIPDKGPPTKNPDDTHLNVPPGPNEDEEKHIDNRGKPIGDVYGALTEVDDLSKCILKSISKKDFGKLRKQGWNPYGKPQRAAMAAAAAAQGMVNFGAALECMAVNNLQDEIVGRLNRAGSRRLQRNPYSPRRTSPIGWGTGGFSTRMR